MVTRTASASAGPVRSVGVEVDGNRASLVVVASGNVVSSNVVVGRDEVDALTSVLADIPTDARVTVALTARTTANRRLNCAAAPVDRADLTAQVHAHERTSVPVSPLMSPGVALAAVSRPPAVPQGRWSVLVCALPADLVADVHSALAERAGRYRVLPAPLAAAGVDGLTLALRHGGCELTLTVDGAVAATAALAAGGIDGVEATLGGGDDVGAQRTEEALSAGGVRDPLAAAEVDRWLTTALSQVQAQCADWRAEGLPVPSGVFVHGRGASAVSLQFLMADHGQPRTPTPAAIASAMLKVPAPQRSVLVGAYLAATSVAPVGPADLAALDDPDVTGARARAAQVAHRRRRIRKAAVVATLVTACAVTPAAASLGHTAWVARTSGAAIAHIATATGRTDGDTRSLVEVDAALRSRPAQPNFDVVALVTGTQVPQIELSSVHAAPERGEVVAAAAGIAGSTAAVADLTDAWRAAGASVTDVVTHARTDGRWDFTAQVRAGQGTP